MTVRLSARQVSALLAVTATLAIPALVLFAVYRPISKWSASMSDDLRDEEVRLVKLQSIANLHASSSIPDQAQWEANFRQDFLKGDSDSIVLADIQTQLRAIIVGNSCELISASALPRRETGGLETVGLKLQMRGQLGNVHQVLHTIEAGTPLLFIERADLRVDEYRGAVQDNPDAAVPNLYAEIDVYGVKWPFSSEREKADTPPAAQGVKNLP